MSEHKIQKGLLFLKNPKVAKMPLDKKIEFLKTKLTPEELDKVLKKFNEGEEFTKYFEPTQDLGTPLDPPQQIATKSNWGWVRTLGAGIIGAIGSAMILNKRENKNKKSKVGQLERVNSFSTFEQRKYELDMALLEGQRNDNKIERLINKHTEAFENLSKQIASLKNSIENLKDTQEKLANSLNNSTENCQVFNQFVSQFNSLDKTLSALNTLKFYFQNILTSPANPQRNKINMTNEDYKNNLSPNRMIRRLLEVSGFHLKGIFMEFDPTQLSSLQSTFTLIQNEIDQLENSELTPESSSDLIQENNKF
ncbi:unnamed protein product [Blepharisma stoltei]|uniref:Peroxin-14 n=1 Tax=Blepharisma stoltei TaxID=1481888 RepID=A0AAU9IGS7_9CILI|nr:unnamed protein product [Blepharisma stoltei]